MKQTNWPNRMSVVQTSEWPSYMSFRDRTTARTAETTPAPTHVTTCFRINHPDS